MPYSAKLTVKRRRGRIDAVALVKAQAAKVLPHLKRALIEGFRPDTGEPRPRKGDGKPLGYDDGVLAKGLYAAPVRATRARASVEIRVPESRRMLTQARADGESFIGRHRILTSDGQVAQLANEAAAEYLETIEL